MSNTYIPNFEQAFEPFMAYGKVAAETAEKAMKIQMDSVKGYTKLGMENFSEGLKVTDLDQMTAYAEKQKMVAKTANDMFMTDAKAFADLGAKFFESTKSMFEDSVKKSMSVAKEAAKSATK